MSEPHEDAQGDVAAVGLLAEPTRRQLYRYVVDAGRAVSRDEAAEGAEVPVHTAKFHLDKLVEGGLLSTEFHKLTGRTGPGSGRPSKHYRRNDAEISVTLPPRQYDLLSRVLADAVAAASKTGDPVAPVVARVAREAGRDIGREFETHGGVEAALRSCGYEPVMEGLDVILCNCPFHQAATRHTELICGLNLDFVSGLLEGVGASRGKACLAPAPGQCCVKVSVE
ncbi:MAG: helix-turn-helix domain-containing protein [Propionibacteriaceae bacterium]|nr:helix-turn-helix domain-containing protein [Propionibacteriaceae bacterium]